MLSVVTPYFKHSGLHIYLFFYMGAVMNRPAELMIENYFHESVLA